MEMDYLAQDILCLPPPIINACLFIPPPVHRDALINYLSVIRSYDDLWASTPFLEYAFDELGETLQDPWTAYHDNIFRQSLFVMALQDLHHFLRRLQTHVDFFYPELQWDIVRYDPSLVTPDEALFDLSSPSTTPPSLQHHAPIDTTPSSMSTPLLHDVVEMSPSPSFEEGILYTSMDTSSTHLEILAPSWDHHTSSIDTLPLSSTPTLVDTAEASSPLIATFFEGPSLSSSTCTTPIHEHCIDILSSPSSIHSDIIEAPPSFIDSSLDGQSPYTSSTYFQISAPVLGLVRFDSCLSSTIPRASILSMYLGGHFCTSSTYASSTSTCASSTPSFVTSGFHVPTVRKPFDFPIFIWDPGGLGCTLEVG